MAKKVEKDMRRWLRARWLLLRPANEAFPLSLPLMTTGFTFGVYTSGACECVFREGAKVASQFEFGLHACACPHPSFFSFLVSANTREHLPTHACMLHTQARHVSLPRRWALPSSSPPCTGATSTAQGSGLWGRASCSLSVAWVLRVWLASADVLLSVLVLTNSARSFLVALLFTGRA